MGKKQKRPHASMAASASNDELPLALKERLSAETIGKLKSQAEDLKKQEASRKEEIRKQEEEKRKTEQKRLENDFSYLLENSNLDWKKHK